MVAADFLGCTADALDAVVEVLADEVASHQALGCDGAARGEGVLLGRDLCVVEIMRDLVHGLVVTLNSEIPVFGVLRGHLRTPDRVRPVCASFPAIRGSNVLGCKVMGF